MSSKTLFISYCHKDKDYMDKVISFLKSAKLSDSFVVWSDENIEIGRKWENDIFNAIDQSKAVLLLISENFLSSDYIMNIEIPRILKRYNKGELQIYPILVNQCPWTEHPWLKQIQRLPRDNVALNEIPEGKRSKELNNLVLQIKKKLFPQSKDQLSKSCIHVVTELTGHHVKHNVTKSYNGTSPFIFDKPVTGKHFFGRKTLLDKMFNHLFRSNDLGNIWLQSDLQVGKTSLLKHIYKLFNNRYHTNTLKKIQFIYFDCQGTTNTENLLNEIAETIAIELEISSNFVNGDNFYYDIFRQVHENDIYIIVLLDEFDSLFTIFDVFDKKICARVIKQMRSNINSIRKIKGQPKLMGAVFSANKPYEYFSKNLGNIGSHLNYLPLNIEWFDDLSIEKLINQYLPNDTFFNVDDIKLCFSISKGHPKLVQKVLNIMYKSKINNNNQAGAIIDEAKTFITETSCFWENIKIPNYILKRLEDLNIIFDEDLGLFSFIF